MTDPDERTINRAIAYVGWTAENKNAEGELQDIREEARAALHRLFRDRRRLELLLEAEKEISHAAIARAKNCEESTQVRVLERLREENAALTKNVHFYAAQGSEGWLEVERLRAMDASEETIQRLADAEAEVERLRWELVQMQDEVARLRRIEEAALMVSLQYPNKDGKVWRDLRAALEEEA